MLKRLVVGLSGGVSLLLVASLSHAECSKDTDCKGDRVCDAGACVSPSAAPPAPAAAPASVEGAPATAPAPVAAPPPAIAAPSSPAAQPSAGVDLAHGSTAKDSEPEMRHHSKGMMVGGIIMVAFVPVALLVAEVANIAHAVCVADGRYTYDSSTGTTTHSSSSCSSNNGVIYGSLLVAAGLAGAGIPMIIIGAKKEPVATASITPWATPHAGGLELRVEL